MQSVKNKHSLVDIEVFATTLSNFYLFDSVNTISLKIYDGSKKNNKIVDKMGEYKSLPLVYS